MDVMRVGSGARHRPSRMYPGLESGFVRWVQLASSIASSTMSSRRLTQIARLRWHKVKLAHEGGVLLTWGPCHSVASYDEQTRLWTVLEKEE